MRQVARVNELSQRRTAPRNYQRHPLLFGQIALVNQRRNDVRIVQVEVVVRTVNVGRNALKYRNVDS